MKKADLMHYIGFEVGIDFMDEKTEYGVLAFDEKTGKFSFKFKKNSREFTADKAQRIWLLKS